jgi:hypothetical protein
MSRYTALVIFLVLFALVLPAPAGAVSCHCFRDRTFEADEPQSADPYVLATTRNSLAAAAAGIEKGAVVKQRMQGATENDLWLYGYLPSRLGVDSGVLQAAVRSKGSWPAALGSLGKDTAALGAGFTAAVKKNDPGAMASALADTVILKAFDASPETVSALHTSGANIAETTLSVLIAGRTALDAEAVYGKVKSGKDTWGSILYSMGVPLDQVGDVVMDKVKAAR